MTQIEEILRQEVKKNGLIPFDRFMELALYCPNFGYYEQPDMSPGRKGDYFTSVSVGSMFAKLLALRFNEWLKCSPQIPVVILESGAHDGRLAAEILSNLAELNAEIHDATEYWILEPSERLRERQQKTLAMSLGKARWFNSWDELSERSVNGVVFSNELFDAMPVKRLGWDATLRHWFEWGVGLKDDKFIWDRMSGKAAPPFPLSESFLDVLPDGFTTEICPAATAWWKDATLRLNSGKILAMDYGLTFPEFLAPQRAQGTLRAYYRHKLVEDVLWKPGSQDITAHVNFDTLISTGVQAGLTTETFATQERFLTEALQLLLKDERRREQWTAAQTRQFKTLTHPGMMGNSFRALVQSRNLK